MRNVEKEISFPTTGVKEKKIPIKKKKKTRVKKNTKIYPQQIVLALLKLKESIFFVCEFDRASLWKNSDPLDGGNGGLYIEVYRY